MTSRKSENENISECESSVSGDGGGVKLQRNLTVLGGISLVVGSMIGSGIFISPTGVITMSGSIGSALIIWVICGLIATIASISYIELGLLIKSSGAEYSYCLRAFNDVIGFLIGWTNIILCKPAGLAVMVIAFAEYALAPLYPGCDAPEILKKCLAISAILLIATVNGLSVKASETLQIVFTVIKLALIASIVLGGFAMLGQGKTENFNDSFAGTSTSLSAWAIAIYNGMWSYEGWNQLNFVSEELQNPTRNFPIVICIGIPLVTTCYLLVNIAYFTVMTADELMTSSAVAVTYGDRVFGSAAWFIPIGVACSTFGSTNGAAFTCARLSFAAGSNGHFPKFLSYLSHSRLTPLMAVIFNSTLGIIMILPPTSSIQALMDYFSFATWCIYFLTFLGLIVMRFREPMKSKPRQFRVWLPLPILMCLIAAYLVIAPIIEYPSLSYLLAVVLIFSGLIFYIPLVWLDWDLPFGLYKKVEVVVQQFFEVVPIDNDNEKTTDEKTD